MFNKGATLISLGCVIAYFDENRHCYSHTLSSQFSDHDFAGLSGARVVRIATHPDFQGMGYGTRALHLLNDYFSGKITSLSEGPPPSPPAEPTVTEPGLLKETIAPRTHLPPLLTKLSERLPEELDYVGVSFGLTAQLLKYVRLTLCIALPLSLGYVSSWEV